MAVVLDLDRAAIGEGVLAEAPPEDPARLAQRLGQSGDVVGAGAADEVGLLEIVAADVEEIAGHAGTNSASGEAVPTADARLPETIETLNRTVTYSAAGIDLAPGETLVDSFTYVVDDSFGAVDTGTVFVTVTGNADGSFTASMSPALEGEGGAPTSLGLMPAPEMLIADSVIA